MEEVSGSWRAPSTHALIVNLLLSFLFAIGLVIAPAARGGVQVLAWLLLLMAVAWFLLSIPIGLGAAAQRLHDLGMSGWYILLGFVPLVNIWIAAIMMFKAGEPAGSTRWG